MVLVLNENSQVLHWEILPVLRKHEFYRMSSVRNILAVMANRFNKASIYGFVKKMNTFLKGRKNTRKERASRKPINFLVL